MLLKDLPVGSMVRLSSYSRHAPYLEKCHWWKGKFEVFNDGKNNYVIDRSGEVRNGISNAQDFQFVLDGLMVMELDGVTYNLTPAEKRKTITIDGIEYEMEEVK